MRFAPPENESSETKDKEMRIFCYMTKPEHG